jgi:Ala-tRNA(Pro) deacylase
LRAHGVSFTLRHHPLAFSARQLAATEHIPSNRVAKPVIADVDGRVVMLVLPASCMVQTSTLASALGGSHAELVDEECLIDLFPDCEVGALPPFGNLYGLDVFVDRRIAQSRHIDFRAGTHTESIGLAYADFERLVQPTVVDVARDLKRN